MISILKARKLLGSVSKNYSDEDLQFLIDQVVCIAEVVTTVAGSKKTTMGIESPNQKADYGNRQ
ncbi:MAG: hypothetical protein HY426_01170 [Candidatus Levybacteria bacterium]|nr:hypothetical protein [Candidatus Levybacteria bacterium]